MLNNMIDYIRIALYAALAAVFLMLYQAWDKEHLTVPAVPQINQTNAKPADNNYIPEVKTESSSAANSTIPVIPMGKHIIHVTTDALSIDIDAAGGNIIKASLLNYPEKLDSKTPFLLLNNSPETRYIAQSGLLSTKGPDTSKGQAVFTSARSEYVLAKDQKTLEVKLNWENKDGLKVTKIFTFHRNNYEINIDYQIHNQSKHTWQGNLYTQLMRKDAPPEGSAGFVNLATYFGAAISSPEKPFEKITFSEMNKKNLSQTITNGWVAMVQHYFLSAWIPEKNSPAHYFSKVTQDGLYTIGMIGPEIKADPGQTTSTHAKLYTGPSIQDQLEKVAPNLQLTIDYGWFWFISIAIFWMMQQIYNIVGNWGWSIVLVTLVIKLMFYHLSAKSYRSMSGLKKLQPMIATLKERYGSDKQKFTQATLELYKKEKVNPMSGCLPILVQIPVFIGLYWVLIESVELRQAPFILWIQDLSIKDPYFILPVLMGISMFLQQRLNPPPPDPMQAKVMMLMPVIFTALFINFPAGLMLYWFVNNMLSFLQQWYIMHSLEKTEKAKKK